GKRGDAPPALRLQLARPPGEPPGDRVRDGAPALERPPRTPSGAPGIGEGHEGGPPPRRRWRRHHQQSGLLSGVAVGAGWLALRNALAAGRRFLPSRDRAARGALPVRIAVAGANGQVGSEVCLLLSR